MMNKINKLLLIMLSVFLILSPCYVHAENEETTPATGENSGETIEPTPSPEPEPKPEITYEIKLDYEEMSLDVGKNSKLNATVTPENSKVIWTSSDENIIKVDENGNITAGTSAGKATITATIDGTTTKATCVITVTRNQGTDATLKSLTIKNGTLDKEFKSDVFEYTVTISPDVSELDIKYELTDKNAKLGFINGNSDLKDGDTITILINAENHTTENENQKTYKLKVVKEKVSLNLKKLELNGYSLNEVFDQETQTYTANIPYEIEIVTVNAKAESDAVTINISGNKNLKVGQNVVKIEVKDKLGNSKTYKIVVVREKEVSVEENPTSIITSSMINNNSKPTNDQTPTDSSDNELFKYIIVSIACLILFAIGGIGIYFYIKTSPKKIKKELKNEISKENISPIAQVEDTQEETEIKTVSNSNIESIMDTKLVETREFQIEELNDSKIENLLDDGEDV